MRITFITVLLFCLGVATLRSEEPTRVACVGDSITEGTGIQKSEQKYPAVLSSILAKGFVVGNFGCGGTMVQDGKRAYATTPQCEQSIEFTPDIVVLMLGTNDAMFGMDNKDKIETAARTLVKRYTSLPSVVILMLPPPFYAKDPTNAKSVAVTQLNNQSMAFIIDIWRKIAASEKLQVVDVNAVLTDKAALFPDALHPNAEGAKIIAELVAPVVTETARKLRAMPGGD